MAKIDVTQIEGYADMTPEQKVAAFEALQLPEPDHTGFVRKSVFDKTASELADWKRKHREQLSAEEREKQERDEEVAALRQQIADLNRRDTISGHKARFLELGYDAALAEETAVAMVDGNADIVFANQKKFLESHDKAYKAQLMSGTSTPPAGKTGDPEKPDFTRMIEEAQAKGDNSAAAYYIRLRNEAEQK